MLPLPGEPLPDGNACANLGARKGAPVGAWRRQEEAPWPEEEAYRGTTTHDRRKTGTERCPKALQEMTGGPEEQGGSR